MKESERVIEKGSERKRLRVSERARDREKERGRGGRGGFETGTVRHTALSDRQEPRQTLTHTKASSTYKHIPRTCTHANNYACVHSTLHTLIHAHRQDRQA